MNLLGHVFLTTFKLFSKAIDVLFHSIHILREKFVKIADLLLDDEIHFAAANLITGVFGSTEGLYFVG